MCAKMQALFRSAPKWLFELTFQISAMVAAVLSFIAALTAEIKFGGLGQDRKGMIRVAFRVIHQESPFTETKAAAGLVFTLTGVAAALGIILLLERLLKARHSTASRRAFTYVYLILVLVCCLGFLIAAIVGAVSSVQWSRLLSQPDSRSVIDFMDGGVTTAIIQTIRNSLAASVVFSLLASVLSAVLSLLVVVYGFVVKHKTHYVDL